MTAPLSKDLRHRLIAAVEDGQSCRSAAKRFGVASVDQIGGVSHLQQRHGIKEAASLGGAGKFIDAVIDPFMRLEQPR